ncbi:tetrahydromethanopterin S-methyltransferase subunit F [Methanosphaera sp. ISO3-F5]|uniref:tetrahydromethanopterin S-methyltransferase subunit F n=1 Tax=Methanosphaera sp. ISO3-F5 TaxID=1452353 RepID=UPI002B25ABB1|nr:tetrahydromethanopterin S-methyltransferase subunit F [Methanosphaera sp. ISO3-F5]WQH65194.1 tetrahydromethanopterin S-methyltransferase subunit F [Methanosphaera sp. ISO3-F5]
MKTIINNIKEVTESIEYKTQLIGRNQRLNSGVHDTRIRGMLIGFMLTVLLVGLPILYYKGGF